jgi:hypothetical protein
VIKSSRGLLYRVESWFLLVGFGVKCLNLKLEMSHGTYDGAVSNTTAVVRYSVEIG